MHEYICVYVCVCLKGEVVAVKNIIINNEQSINKTLVVVGFVKPMVSNIETYN